jgi:aerobic carbon-monoxide dehydrogenase small subunit
VKRYQGRTKLVLTVNGEERIVYVDPGDTLLWTLRRGLGLTGTKSGCENGDCGACTVQLDGVPVKSCYTLTVDAEDRAVTTIEGLHDTPVQEGFREEYGFQCGFCTSGFIVNMDALMKTCPGESQQSPPVTADRERDHDHDRDHDREAGLLRSVEVDWLRSNICRCTGYEGIRKAARYARERTDGSTSRRPSGDSS